MVEWGLLSMIFVGLSFGAGLLPPILVSVERYRGYPSVYGLVLMISLVPLAGLWLNPDVDISFVLAFLQNGGALSIALLFSWPFIKYIGTHDSDKRKHEEFILHKAVGVLLWRGEITHEEARIVDTFGRDNRSIPDRLDALDPFKRMSIEREMIIEELVQSYRRRFGLKR